MFHGPQPSARWYFSSASSMSRTTTAICEIRSIGSDSTSSCPYKSRSARTAWGHRPDVGHDAVLDHVEDVVEVHRRRPVAAHHLGHVAEVERGRGREIDEAVLLGVVADRPT